MRVVATIAGKEIRERLRNRWVLGATLLLAALSLVLGLLGSAPTGTVAVTPLAVTVVSLASLTIFLVPLIALLISYDAIVGEIDAGTMTLLLAYPVARGQVLAGKFLSHVAILAFATVVGYGAAGLAVSGLRGGGLEAWAAFGTMLGTSVLLGACFVGIGYLISALARERSAAAGFAIGVWLAFVLLYDMALLGLLVAGQGKWIDAALFRYLLLANPADAYRLLNLSGMENVRLVSGMAALGREMAFGQAALLAALLLWVALPVGIAGLVFGRREV